ncbi:MULTISPECIES: DUF6745 domain-containing protein [Nostocales]|uniref:DUF6745 domain-containing protein n=3 Tax=Nostocales TaxID=1161 RepID=A0A0C1R3J9_9CYAN|nr:hypothetical protein [Tolypothrix bouteillei]KAF3890555.1 hypothetical protein DA73_0400037710 [Tolypothrix bouteillei VB521301]
MLQIKLTTEQQALISTYRDKWCKLALSTQEVEIEQATTAVEAIYSLMGKPKPSVFYFASPIAAIEQFDFLKIWGNQTIDIETQLIQSVRKQLSHELWLELHSKLYEALHQELWNSIGRRIYTAVVEQSQLIHSLNDEDASSYFNPAQDCVPTEYLVSMACLFDFCYSVLNCSINRELWQAYQLLVQHCGWLWTYEGVCLVCDRPYHLERDSQGLLHGEGHPAIQLRDGFSSIYAYHGVILPEKYGMVHPNKWRSQWLLTENNAELRRVLIQGIGYSKICQELQAKKLDTWQEYRLLKIDAINDVEPIHLLAMTCPSTAHVHALRVPPDITSAREAIRWVNWGIDPTEFSLQT